ncbi:MAG: asparagine--tRNA ligase [Firmicutes bacterium]|nr:asparagine--tRNA ligase [Bacillota bacterium]
MAIIEQRLIFAEPQQYADQNIEVCGWIRNNRSSNKFGFIELNDGTFFKSVQVVYESQLIDNFDEVAKLPLATALTVTGKLELTPGAKQPFEIKASSIAVEAPSDADYPIQNKRHSLEYLRTQLHLRPRTNTFSAVFRVRSVAAYAIHKFFQDKGFVYAHAPLITASDAEGAGEMFQVTTLDLDNIPRKEDGSVDYDKDFFAKPANLTVSGQLEGEIFALAFKNIYTFGPTFRAENSNTARHASEFWMIEPEMAFCDLSQNMDIIEEMVKYIISYTMEHCPEEMKFFNSFVDKGLLDRLNHVVNSTFKRLPYTEEDQDRSDDNGIKKSLKPHLHQSGIILLFVDCHIAADQRKAVHGTVGKDLQKPVCAVLRRAFHAEFQDSSLFQNMKDAHHIH